MPWHQALRWSLLGLLLGSSGCTRVCTPEACWASVISSPTATLRTLDRETCAKVEMRVGRLVKITRWHATGITIEQCQRLFESLEPH